MNTNPKNGGPAFPTAYPDVEAGGYSSSGEGMSLRDWFAGMALQGLYAGKKSAVTDPTLYIRAAWELADAMLAEREKTP